MRSEYNVIQQLIWNSEIRQSFKENPGQTISKYFPEIEGKENFINCQYSGIEESSYYRIASCCRALKTIFPCAHSLINAFGGLPFIEKLLATYLDAPKPGTAVYELFDGYTLAPEAIKTARTFSWKTDNDWISPVLEYEWAVWHTKRVAQGWESVIPSRGILPESACLFGCNFDLKSLLADLVRMKAASVPEDVFRWRIRPLFGIDSCYLIFPKSSEIAEVEIDFDSFTTLKKHIETNSSVPSYLITALNETGLQVNTAYDLQ